MAGRVGTSQNPAPDKIIAPIDFERRRKAQLRKQARIDEANSDDFADSVQAYAHLHGLNAQQVLDDEKDARARGRAGSPGLADFLKGAKVEPATPATPQPANSLRRKASKASRRTVGAANSAGVAAGGAYGKPLTVARAGGVGVQAGGFILGVMAYAIGINYIRYGLPGVKAYLKAKLTNQTTPIATLAKGNA